LSDIRAFITSDIHPAVEKQIIQPFMLTCYRKTRNICSSLWAIFRPIWMCGSWKNLKLEISN